MRAELLLPFLNGRDAERRAKPGGQAGLHGRCLGLGPGVVLADGDPEDAIGETPSYPLVASDGIGEDGLAGPAHAVEGQGCLVGCGDDDGPGGRPQEFLTARLDLLRTRQEVTRQVGDQVESAESVGRCLTARRGSDGLADMPGHVRERLVPVFSQPVTGLPPVGTAWSFPNGAFCQPSTGRRMTGMTLASPLSCRCRARFISTSQQ